MWDWYTTITYYLDCFRSSHNSLWVVYDVTPLILQYVLERCRFPHSIVFMLMFPLWHCHLYEFHCGNANFCSLEMFWDLKNWICQYHCMFVFVEVFKYMISTTKWSSIIIVNMGIGLRIEITFAPNSNRIARRRYSVTILKDTKIASKKPCSSV